MLLDVLRNDIETWNAALRAYDIQDFRQSLELFSGIADTAKLVTNMALVHAAIGEHESVVERLTEALDLDQYLTIAYFQRGVSNHLLKKYDDALRDFDTALVQLRDINIDDEDNDIEFQLFPAEVIFNKALSLMRLGREDDGLSAFLEAGRLRASSAHDIIEDAIKARGAGCVPFSVPAGVLYRPSESLVRFLRQDDSEDHHSAAAASEPSLIPSDSSLLTLQPPSIFGSIRKSFIRSKSDASSTYAPTFRSHTTSYQDTVASLHKSFALADPDIVPNFYLSTPTRSELNKVLGEDIITLSAEITTIPCAGLRISHGRLAGLMAWRFFVQLDETSPKFRNCPRPGIITNFILDTGSGHSPVPPETLKALGYTGSLSPGTEIILNVQGIRTNCVVARPEEAGRLCGQFMRAGSLTLYFDEKLDAPVLYVADEVLDRPKSDSIPRTIKATSSWLMLLQKVLMMARLSKGFS